MKTRTIKVKEYKTYSVDYKGQIEINWFSFPPDNQCSFSNLKKAEAYSNRVKKRRIRKLKEDIERFNRWIKEASLELEEANAHVE